MVKWLPVFIRRALADLIVFELELVPAQDVASFKAALAAAVRKALRV